MNGTMSDKNVFIWSAFGDNKGLPLGGQADGKNIDLIFDLGRPLDKAVEKWKSFKGVYDVLNKQHDDKEYVAKVKRTLEWYKKRYPLSFVSQFSKEELEKLDVLNLNLMIPFANKKVVDILKSICPSEIESFPIEIKTPTGITNDFYLLNITNRIQNALDKPNCIYKIGMFKKEGEENSISGTGSFDRILLNEGCMKNNHIGRLYEDLGEVMLSKQLVDEFTKEKIYGFNVEIFEDSINGHFRFNYMPDGKTLKV